MVNIMAINYDLLNTKYKALSLLKKISLLEKINGLSLKIHPTTITGAVENDRQHPPQVIRGLFNELTKMDFYSDNLFTPTNELPQRYIEGVVNYLSYGNNKKLNHAMYSTLIFSRWLFDVYNENGFPMSSKPFLSDYYFDLLKTKQINLINDAEKALNYFITDSIKRNTFKIHFLDAIMALLLPVFIDDGHAESAYCLIGNMLLDNGYKNEAIKLFSTSTQIEDDYYTGYIGLADAYRYKNEYQNAIVNYNTALSIVYKYRNKNIKPYFLTDIKDELSLSVDCHYGISICQANLNNFDLSLHHINEALRLDSGSYFGYKTDKFESLDNVRSFIHELFAQYKKTSDVELDFSTSAKLDPKISEVFSTLYQNNYFGSQHESWKNLSPDSLKILKNIFFFETIFANIETDDYSPITSQYFKIIEIELFNRILKKLELWIKTHSIDNLSFSNSIFSNKTFNKVTLGSYRFIFSELAVKDFLKQIYNDYYNFLTSDLIRILEKIIELRNGANHRSLTSKAKHSAIKEIIIKEGLFDILCKL